MSAQKRKDDNELPIKNELDVLNDLDSGLLSQRKIAEKYAIGRSTVQRIAASREKLEQEADNTADLSCKRIKRSMRNEDIKKCLLEFFRRRPDKNIPLTGVILQEKAKLYADS